MRYIVNVTSNIEVGDSGPHTVGSHVLHISGTYTGLSIVTKSYLKIPVNDPKQGAPLTIADRQPIAYTPKKTGVATDPTVAAITGNGTYAVASDSMQLVLEITIATGSVVIDVQPLRG